MRPGRIMLDVMPCEAISEDSVLFQPTSAPRSVLESARLGIGSKTPEEATVRMRPKPCAFIRGRIALVSVMTRTPLDWKTLYSFSSSMLPHDRGGGPPGL